MPGGRIWSCAPRRAALVPYSSRWSAGKRGSAIDAPFAGCTTVPAANPASIWSGGPRRSCWRGDGDGKAKPCVTRAARRSWDLRTSGAPRRAWIGLRPCHESQTQLRLHNNCKYTLASRGTSSARRQADAPCCAPLHACHSRDVDPTHSNHRHTASESRRTVDGLWWG